MRIFSAEEVDSKTKVKLAESTERTRKLNEAEAIAAKNLSIARELERTEKARIEHELSELEEATRSRRQTLEGEVAALEERKRQAMKPVTSLRKEAQSEKDTAERMQGVLKRKLADVQEREELLLERVDAVNEREDRLKQWEEDLQTRDDRMRSEENRLRESQSELARKWTDYHADVHQANSVLDRKQRDLAAERSALEGYRHTLEAEKKKIAEDRCAIQDGYESLSRAREEILGRKT